MNVTSVVPWKLEQVSSIVVANSDLETSNQTAVSIKFGIMNTTLLQNYIDQIYAVFKEEKTYILIEVT